MATKKSSRTPSKAAVNQDSRTLSMLVHILALFTSFLGPLIVLLASDDLTVKKHAKNALNWQISYIIYVIASIILIFVLVGILTLIAVSLANTIFCIIAAVKANEDEFWTYPMSITFIKE